MSNSVVTQSKDIARKMAEEAVRILRSMKGLNVQLFDVSETAPFTDYYVLCTGRSNTHMRALAREADDKMAELGFVAVSVEGRSSDAWILLDFSHVIVHIFSREARDFYKLEHLWADADRVDPESLINQEGEESNEV